MADAFTSLNRLASDCSPDLIVTHACEGGHIDHDACHYLAKHVAAVHGLPVMEFPLYWKDDHDQDIFQQFRNAGEDEMVLELTEQEMEVKRQMIAAYKTQQGLTSVFHLHTERFRAVRKGNGETCSWPDYAFENRRERLKASAFLQKIAEFERSLSITLGTSLGCET
jgi:LmbE family N-acetylglucosaminyl deacetylase